MLETPHPEDVLAGDHPAGVAERFRDNADRRAGEPEGALRRWSRLAETAREELSVARLLEAHLDAQTISAELGGPRRRRGQYWGVWAAEPPNGRVRATRRAGGHWRLTGTKRWCSGIGMCTHALITAHADDGKRLLAVDLDQPGVSGATDWAAAGMAATRTGTVELDEVAADEVGPPGAYLDRAGFWHGAIGVASCWYGGAIGVAAPLRAAGKAGKLDPHGLAHFGAVDSALHGAGCALRAAAERIDGGTLTDIDDARTEALRVRSIVESAATVVLDRVGRALGPGPLAHDAAHTQRVSDLTVYLRQSHAERDLADLGELAAAAEPGAL